MGRRTSSGRIGAPTFGGLLADAETIRSDDNKDIIFDPTGTGIVKSEAHFQIQNQNSLRFGDANDSNYVAFQAPTTVNSDLTWTLPAADGTAGYVLTTDGSGTLSWTVKSVSVAENNTDSTPNFIYYNTTNTGNVTQLRFAETLRPLTYQPSTGTLNVTSLSCNSADINGGTIDGTTIGGSSPNAGTFTTLTATSITETSSITYKENVTPIENSIEILSKLQGVLYDRKDGSAKKEAGLIAEDVAPVIPNVITYKDGKPEGIHYTKLSVYLIEAVKSLKDEIDLLKGRN